MSSSVSLNHTDEAAAVDRAARRYLALLQAALLDKHYLDNEARLAYALECARAGLVPEVKTLADPQRHLRTVYERLRNARAAGAGPRDSAFDVPYTAMGHGRLAHLQQCLDVVRSEPVPGDLVECATGRRGGAIFLRGYLDAYEIEARQVWVAGEFRQPGAHLNVVREGFDRFGLLDERVRFLQGDPSALADAAIERVALLRLGTGSYDGTRRALEALYDRVADGGFVVVDDYAADEPRRAVDEFRATRAIAAPIDRVDWSGAAWRACGSPQPVRPRIASARSNGYARLAPAVAGAAKDLSVVVVVHNMQREAARSLHALSRAYQREIDDVDYEVLVVENGSADDQCLGAAYVESFGPEFTYLDLDDDATPSPAHALNRGIDASRGKVLALMVDGAHVLTPRVLRFGLLGLDAYAPAMVATQQWYVGPGQQPEAVAAGYDERFEDELFEEIEWPADGYRLFDIGHFVGDRDWFDGMWESNCIFVPRALLEQFGCFDESFSMAGGGYANLDLYERMGATPGVSVVSILGEGSFHQAHGGTTTNEPDAVGRGALLASYGEHYADLRGHVYRGPGKPVHYVGSMFEAARRTRARRRTSSVFFQRGLRDGRDERPRHPIPLPEELELEFTDAYWRSAAWRETTWLGRPVPKCPTDLLVYQELIATVRPDWIIETNTGGGGRARFLASICDLVDHGEVVSIDLTAAPTLPEHPRITYLAGDMANDATADEVRAIVGGTPRALVLFGLASRARLLRAFEAYSPLVPVGSYVVFEETITNGNPVWPGMGPGPAEAIKRILALHPEFVRDHSKEKLLLTFNPGGFLRRIRPS